MGQPRPGVEQPLRRAAQAPGRARRGQPASSSSGSASLTATRCCSAASTRRCRWARSTASPTSSRTSISRRAAISRTCSRTGWARWWCRASCPRCRPRPGVSPTSGRRWATPPTRCMRDLLGLGRRGDCSRLRAQQDHLTPGDPCMPIVPRHHVPSPTPLPARRHSRDRCRHRHRGAVLRHACWASSAPTCSRSSTPIGGDALRRFGTPSQRGDTLTWLSEARNKRSVTLDLRPPEGVEVFKQLIAQTDVLCENFRTGTLEKWGLGWDVLHDDQSAPRSCCASPATGRPARTATAPASRASPTPSAASPISPACPRARRSRPAPPRWATT